MLSNFNRDAHGWQKLGPRIANHRLDHATVTRATLARVLWLQLADAIGKLQTTGLCAHLTMFREVLAERQGNARNVADAPVTVETALKWCAASVCAARLLLRTIT